MIAPLPLLESEYFWDHPGCRVTLNGAGPVMTVRRMVPNAGRVLEWGQHTVQPGSLVRDAHQEMIFTGSTVRPVVAQRTPATVSGTVVELLSPTSVRVAWTEGDRVVVAANALVAVARPQDMITRCAETHAR